MHCRDYHRLLFLDSFFESLVDDVMRMTHQKFLSEHKLHIQKFMIQKRENRFAPIRSFCGHFTKSSDFCQNLIMPMLSLRYANWENTIVCLTISGPSLEKPSSQILRLKTDLMIFWVILTEIFPGLSLGIVVRRYFMVNLLFLLQRGFLILIKDVLIYLNVIK